MAHLACVLRLITFFLLYKFKAPRNKMEPGKNFWLCGGSSSNNALPLSLSELLPYSAYKPFA